MSSKPNCTIYVGNIQYTTSEEQLRELFGASGRQICWVKIVVDPKTRKPVGFAFVEFATVEEAAEVVKIFDRTIFGGRTLKVALSRPKARQSGQKRNSSRGD